MTSRSLADVRAAKEKVAALIAENQAVNAIGITQDEHGYCVKVNLAADSAEGIPEEVDGVPVRVEVIGTIQKQVPD